MCLVARLSMGASTLLLLLGSAAFLGGRTFCASQPDYREVPLGAQAPEADGEPSAPLLAEDVEPSPPI